MGARASSGNVCLRGAGPRRRRFRSLSLSSSAACLPPGAGVGDDPLGIGRARGLEMIQFLERALPLGLVQARQRLVPFCNRFGRFGGLLG